MNLTIDFNGDGKSFLCYMIGENNKHATFFKNTWMDQFDNFVFYKRIIKL